MRCRQCILGVFTSLRLEPLKLICKPSSLLPRQLWKGTLRQILGIGSLLAQNTMTTTLCWSNNRSSLEADVPPLRQPKIGCGRKWTLAKTWNVGKCWFLLSFKENDRRCSLSIYNLEATRAAAIQRLLLAYQARFGPPPSPPAKGLTGLNRACRRVFHKSVSHRAIVLAKSAVAESADDRMAKMAAPCGESRDLKPVPGVPAGSSFQRRGLRKSFTFTALGLYGHRKKRARFVLRLYHFLHSIPSSCFWLTNILWK